MTIFEAERAPSGTLNRQPRALAAPEYILFLGGGEGTTSRGRSKATIQGGCSSNGRRRVEIHEKSSGGLLFLTKKGVGALYLFFRRKIVLGHAMALFGNEEGDVGPFVMTEDGEEWFPFTLDNLEMDRGCTPLDQVSKPMEQVRLLGVARLTFLSCERRSAARKGTQHRESRRSWPIPVWNRHAPARGRGWRRALALLGRERQPCPSRSLAGWAGAAG